MKLSDKQYDFLKNLLLIYIPAVETFILAVTRIWQLNIPAEQIVATLSAFAVMLGAFLKIKTEQYLNEQNSEDLEEYIPEEVDQKVK